MGGKKPASPFYRHKEGRSTCTGRSEVVVFSPNRGCSDRLLLEVHCGVLESMVPGMAVVLGSLLALRRSRWCPGCSCGRYRPPCRGRGMLQYTPGISPKLSEWLHPRAVEIQRFCLGERLFCPPGSTVEEPPELSRLKCAGHHPKGNTGSNTLQTEQFLVCRVTSQYNHRFSDRTSIPRMKASPVILQPYIFYNTGIVFITSLKHHYRSKLSKTLHKT